MAFVILDGKVFSTDRCGEKTTSVQGKQIDLWFSGKAHEPGGNIQALSAPDGVPLWVSEVEPGSVHDLRAAREHVLGALYWAASQLDLPTLADGGYAGAGIGVHTPIKRPTDGQVLDVDNRTYNALLRGLRCLGERGFAVPNSVYSPRVVQDQVAGMLGRMPSEWKLYWTGGAALQGPSRSDAWSDLAQREERLGFRRRQPILVAPDYRVDPRLSEFFRRSRFATRARGTQESYVLDYRLLFTFLWQRGRNWDEIRAEDLEDYEYWRRRDMNNPGRIGGSKWGRELAAFRLFYDWAVSRRHMTGSPVVLRTKQLPDGSSVKVPELAPTDTRSYNVKWLTPRAYRVWRDVGLRGYTAGGVPDTSWRGRNDGRDAAFADLLVSSGLRRREAGSLLLVELPDMAVSQRYYAAHVAAATAKRADRYFYVARSALKAIDAYRVSSRAEAVARAQRAGVYDALATCWLVRNVTGRGTVQWVDEHGRPGKSTLDDLDDLARLNLYVEGGHGIEPMAVSLTEAGLPMRYRSWNRVFGLANARCAAQGLKVFCSPHMLRHSFALQMVISLHYALDRRLGLSAADRKYYETVYGNVWSLVKDLLGHASEETTKEVYLEPVRGLQLDTLLNDASDESADELLTRLAEQTGLILDVPQDVNA